MKKESIREMDDEKKSKFTKDTSSSKKTNGNNSKSDSTKSDPMKETQRKKANPKKEDEAIEVESENVKVVKIPGSAIMKAYYWKKEDMTFLAIGQIGIEKRQGDQTKELQKEYGEMNTDQIIKVIAATIAAQEKITKK